MSRVSVGLAIGLLVSFSSAATWDAGLITTVDAEQRREDDALQKTELTLNGRLDIGFSDRWSSRVAIRMRADSKDAIEPGRPEQASRSSYNRRWFFGESGEVELREAYVDDRIGGGLLRIGKQQIVWGQADGLRVLDVVNPFSLREFVIPDPQDRRIPLWSIRADVPVGASTLQWVWIIDPTYNELPSAGAEFEITTPLLVPRRSALPFEVRTAEPSQGVHGSDAGLRWSATPGGWDLTLNYLHHYYDDPVPFLRADPQLSVQPEYRRTHLIGGTFANALGSTTVRGEIGYSTDRWFLTRSALDADRVFSSPELAWVIGIDNLAFENTLISAQYFQSDVRDPELEMTRAKIERQITALIQRRFANDTFTLRGLWLRSLNRGDGSIQARATWQFGNLALSASMDRFYGDEAGLFGEFRDASRFGLHIEWGT